VSVQASQHFEAIAGFNPLVEFALCSFGGAKLQAFCLVVCPIGALAYFATITGSLASCARFEWLRFVVLCLAAALAGAVLATHSCCASGHTERMQGQCCGSVVNYKLMIDTKTFLHRAHFS
jgi:hypothetical protein